MWTVKKFKDEVLAGPMSLMYVLGEVKELMEELVDLNPNGVREEWSDVTLCALLWLSKYLPLGWVPVLPGLGLYAAEKFYIRRHVWVLIFKHHNRVFRKEYLIEGGNYHRREKVIRVLARAGFHDEPDWDWISRIY